MEAKLTSNSEIEKALQNSQFLNQCELQHCAERVSSLLDVVAAAMQSDGEELKYNPYLPTLEIAIEYMQRINRGIARLQDSDF